MSAEEYNKLASGKKPGGYKDRPEHRLQLAIIDAAKRLGWDVHWRPDWQWYAVRQYADAHPWARRFLEWSDNGFPDLLLIHPWQRRALYIECKAGGNTLSDKQKHWAVTLTRAGVEYAIWRETDWQSGAVERALKGQRLDEQ